MKNKPILCLDFDGVIHDYRHGWQDGEIYGQLTPGFLAWAEQAAQLFNLVIQSSRAKNPQGLQQILDWLLDQAIKDDMAHVVGMMPIQATKPPAFVSIDDRALTFKGDWDDPDFYPAHLIRFKPWMMKEE